MKSFWPVFRRLTRISFFVGSEKIEEALGLLDEYNAALEELAAEVGAQIEY